MQVLLAGILLATPAAPCNSALCSCALVADVRLGVQEALTSDAAIFEGQVLSTRDTSVRAALQQGQPEQELRSVLVTMVVRQAWKGVEADTVRLLRPIDLCSYPFRAGHAYVVFAHRFDLPGTPAATSRLSTSLCSYTTETAKAGPVLTALGPPQRQQLSH